MKIQFILTGEGTSDLNLVDHIENLLIEEGFTEASGEAPDLSMFQRPIGRTIREKLEALLKHYPNADVIFVHRDADNAGIMQREQEIITATDGLISVDRIIPVIPMTQLETWLLTDREAIKRIAGNVDYRGRLDCIPAIRRLESVLDAKGLLLEALCEASETQGARLRKFKNRFCEMRARLAFDLNVGGPIKDLPSYQRFREKITNFARQKMRNQAKLAEPLQQ
ncbi:hypothetical protein [Burkholderia gladioli]|uniref:hypothetical protein n=1 Tax=Burkholderia gladioli TaxID=28095 RepID=UPI0012F8EDA6|nr:hypothetical protein [Burkholderia gladioli]NHH78979.1 hypothetical protein [Burkholderia gladioli]